MREKIRKKILAAILEVAEMDESEITMDMTLVDDLGFDSLKFVALMAAVEEKIDVMVPYADMKRVSTVGEFIDMATELRLN